MKLSEMPKNSEEKTQKTKATKRDISSAYEELKNCSADELMSRLEKEIKTQKENGTFDFDGLWSTIERIKIYLPNQTYQNMLKIIENLR